ncbi:MAG TPA: AraC family transcriptional regulator [Mycobacteriales bacterium]|nr:AraC family transcriptional regulator [Mycobacteriales bacterium]
MTELPAVVLRAPAGGRPFRLGRRAPLPELADVVGHFWCVEWTLPEGSVHDQEVVSHPCGHLTVEADGAFLQGVPTHRFERRLTGTGRVVSAHLRPAALSALTDLPAARLTDARTPLAEAMPDAPGLDKVRAAEGPEAGMDALEDWFRALGPRRRAGAELVDEAVDLIAARTDLTRVDALAAELDVTVRTLQRRFDRHLGVGPKWVLNRCRIQDALGVIESGGEVDWATLAAGLGYTDQSHFTNAFTALVGVPPGAYSSRPTGPQSPNGDDRPAEGDRPAH